MEITYLELPTSDLQVQKDFYANVLELPVTLSRADLEVKAGKTDILFTRAAPDFDGAYHFAFNIPENQFRAAKEWISNRIPLLRDENGKVEFESETVKYLSEMGRGMITEKDLAESDKFVEKQIEKAIRKLL